MRTLTSICLLFVVASFTWAAPASVQSEGPAFIINDDDGVPYLWVYGDVDRPPSPAFDLIPVHPFERTGVEGFAVLRFTVNTSGGVEDLRTVRASEREFGMSAYQAHSKARYAPARKNGAIVQCEVERLFRFRVEEKQNPEAQPGATDNPDDAKRLREDH